MFFSSMNRLRLTLKEMLELWLSVTCAINGLEAFENQEHTFDIIISDIRMPQFSGMDFLKMLSAEYKQKIPIIMVSAYPDMEETRLMELGARKLMTKPINVRSLVDQLELLVGTKSRNPSCRQSINI